MPSILSSLFAPTVAATITAAATRRRLTTTTMAATAASHKDASRVVVFLDHGKYQGHFIPTLAVAELFVRKGFTVHYFASEIVQERIERYVHVDPLKDQLIRRLQQ